MANAAHHVSAGAVRLRQPTPDLHALQGGFVENVRKLERTAEELSAGGSDIGEEIRKMNELSRQSSLQSSHHGDISVIRPSVMERMNSMQSARRPSSRRSIDGNSVTSSGPYSPNRLVWSPNTISMSASWSQLPPNAAPSKTHFSPQPVRASYAASEESIRSHNAHTSSFARRYDEIAGEIQESLQHIPPSLPGDSSSSDLRTSLHAPLEHRRSMDTLQEAQAAFQDFDGVHFSPDTNEIIEMDHNGNEIRRISVRSASGRQSLAAASLLQNARALAHHPVVPPPAEGMAYYPAPVPRTLNLPKRLSQLPAATVQSKSKTQMLNRLSNEAGAAAPWLAQGNDTLSGASASRHSRVASYQNGQTHRVSSNTLNLPPHARAELFFKHRQVQQDVELKSGSAVATLDSILEASATAPVSAFIDHPFAGDVRKSVYSVEHNTQKNNPANPSIPEFEESTKMKRRSGSISGVLRKVVSSDDISRAAASPASRNGPNKLQKRRSCMSLGDDLERQGANIHTNPATSVLDVDLGESNEHMAAMLTGDVDAEVREAETQEDVEGDSVFVKPSTLLAELQVRKAQQRSRGRTAVTAFPNGMHSTLLELDAVQQIAQQKRKGQPITLAWEDPGQHDLQQNAQAEDEDVPLGILISGNGGMTNPRIGDGKDWDRWLGLIQRRNLEDEEPLSSRRNRLRGVPPGRQPPFIQPEPQINGHGKDQGDDHETLAQRLRRIKAQGDSIAVEESAASAPEEHVSAGFAADVLGHFATFAVKDGDGEKGTSVPLAKSASSPDHEEETLVQRKARLQREREANGQQVSTDRLRQTSMRVESTQGTLFNGNGHPSAGQATYHNSMGAMRFSTNPTHPAFGANAVPYGYSTFAPMQHSVSSHFSQQWRNRNTVLPPQMASAAFMGNAYHPGMMNGTYAAHAQRMDSSGGLGIAMTEEQIPAPSRAVIDRWRLGVQ